MTRRLRFTPALLADVRRRYEATDEPLANLAAELGCCYETVRNVAARERWVRYQPPPRDLTPAARLRLKAEALAQASQFPPPLWGRVREGGGASKQERSPPPASLRCASAGDLPPPGGGEERDAGGGEEIAASGEAPLVADTARALHGELHALLAEVRAARARMKRDGAGKYGLREAAQAIASLTATLARLQDLQAAAPSPTSGPDYDDMPADLDEFRHALARRIEAFFASRPDAGDAGEPVADGADEA